MLDMDFLLHATNDRWQMMQWERVGLAGVLATVRPKGALEIGVFHGGSLGLISRYAEHVIGIDLDEAVLQRVHPPRNATLRIGASKDLIPQALAEFESRMPLNFVLVDGDHSREGVRRDLELLLAYLPSEPLVILMHDSANAETRGGILAVDWLANHYVKFVDCDFVPGQIIEHTVEGTRAEIWGGLALAYLDPRPRVGLPEIRQSARTSIRCLQHCADNLAILDR